MPYKFGEYVSTYVDPNSVKISEALQERFLSTFAANDQLATAIDQMQAALPFENDMQRKRQLQREMENKLTVLSERGDYENLGFQVHKAAKDFTKEYAPIKENYARYQTALQELQKGVDAKEINAEYAQMFPAYMSRNYKGFEIDPETGRVKEGTMFTAPSIIKDPKVFDKIKDAIAIIKPEGREIKSNQIGVGPDGRYNVTTESGTDYISPEVVKQAIETVMNDPDVRAYTTQVADMKAYSYQKSGALPEVINSQTTQVTEAIKAYQEAIDKGRLTTAEKKQAANNIVALNEELQKLATASGDEKVAYDYVRNKIANEMYKPMTDFVVDAASYEKTKQSTIYDENQAWLANYKSELDYKNANPSLEHASEVYAEGSYGGKTVAEKQQFVQNNIAESMRLYAEAENDKSLSPDEKRAKQRQAAQFKDNAMLAQHFIDKAINSSIGYKDLEKHDPTIVNVVKELYPNITTAQMGQKLVEILANPQSESFKQFETLFNSKYGDKALANHFSTYYNATRQLGQGVDISDRLGKDSNVQRKGVVNEFIDYKFAGKQLAEKFSNEINAEHVNNKFLEMKTSSVAISGALPAMSVAESKAATLAAKDYFTGWVIPENVTVQNVTGDGIEEQSGNDLKGYKTLRHKFIPDYGTMGAWELELQNDENEIKTVIVSGEQITSPALKKYMNSPSMKFAQKVNKYNTREKGDVTSFKVEGKIVEGRQSFPMTIYVRSEGNGDPLVAVQDVKGQFSDVYTDSKGNLQVKKSDTPIFNRMDSPQYQAIVNSDLYIFD